MPRRNKSYAIDQCALYRCGTRKKLLQLLQTTPTKLAELKAAGTLYHRMEKPKKNGGVREVYAPRYDLKRIQTRLSELLMRVEAPDYLMSPVRGRSNIDNAAAHRNAPSHRLIDIEDFYPSCTAAKVAWFFGKVMDCPPDVVAILVWLTTLDGALPQGSPASPILAFLSYRDMWDEIAEIAAKNDNRLTVYVDDVTLSGEVVLGRTLWEVKGALRKHGHRTKENKEESRYGTPVTVTGVVLRTGVLLLPNVQHQKRYQLRKALERMPKGPERLRTEAALAGHDETERQIAKRFMQVPAVMSDPFHPPRER